MKTVGLLGAKLVLRDAAGSGLLQGVHGTEAGGCDCPWGVGLGPVTAGSMLDSSPTRAGSECPPSDPFCLMLVYMAAFMSVIKLIL